MPRTPAPRLPARSALAGVSWRFVIQAARVTLEVNGRAATDSELRALALGGYGHFTAMQLRGGRTRGLQLHLEDSSLQQVAYQRSLAHLKHAGDFGQSYYGRLAERNGFGEALLTGPDGLISEGSMTNIGFFDGTAVIWPAAAMLAGITMQLMRARLTLPQRHSPVRVADLGSFEAVFITNSHGVAAVTQVDDRRLAVDTAFISMLKDCYESVPWDEV
jgi:hypothetical protein